MYDEIKILIIGTSTLSNLFPNSWKHFICSSHTSIFDNKWAFPNNKYKQDTSLIMNCID